MKSATMVPVRALLLESLHPKAIEILTGIVREGGLGHARGVAALSAFLSVRAPGITVIEAVRRFSSVQRMTLRLRRGAGRGSQLDSASKGLLAAVEEIESSLGDAETNGGRPHDLPVVHHCRTAFGQIVSDLQSRGTLSPEQIQKACKIGECAPK